MHPYLIRTDSFALGWENVLIMIAILVAVWWAIRRAAPRGAAYQDMLLDLSLWLVPAGILGARAWEMIWVWDEYLDRPWARFAVWEGGLSIQGAILGGLSAALLFARVRRVRAWELLDLIAPPVLLGQAIGRLGCLLSGDAYGRPVAEVPWLPPWLGLIYHPESPAGQRFPGVPLIPAEGLEMLADLAILVVLLRLAPLRAVPGRVTLTYALLYSLARFGLEFLRADSLLIGGLKVAQLLSVAVVLVAGALLATRQPAERRIVH